MSWYGIDSVDKAFSRTRKLLFEPFNFWKWARLALIILLLNGFSGFGNSGMNYQGNSQDLENVIQDLEREGSLDHFDFADIHLGVLSDTSLFDSGALASSGLFDEIGSFPKLGFIIFIIVLIFLIGLLFVYISNVMEFVFVESLVTNEVKFLAYSKKFLGKGFNLFIIRIVLGLIFLFFLGIAMFPFFSKVIAAPGEFDWTVFFGGIAWLLTVFLVLAFASLLIGSILNLAIPLSLYRQTGILSAFGLVCKNFRQSWKEMLIYWIIRILIRILVGIAVFFLALLVFLGFALVFLIVDGILYFLLSVLVSGSLLWLLLSPVLLLEFLLFLVTLAFLNVPFIVFIKYHMLSFLEMWYPGAGIPFFDTPQSGEEKGHSFSTFEISGVNDSEVNDSEVNDSEVNNSEVNDSEVNDSEVNDSEVNKI